MHKYLKMATSYADNHNYHHNIDYYLSAVIIKGGKPISIGYNKHNTNSFVEHYANIARGAGRDFCLSTYAEMDKSPNNLFILIFFLLTILFDL